MDYPGEKLAIKIWETITDRGLSGLLRPFQIRREGRARLEVRRHEILLTAQAEKDVEDIRAGAKVFNADNELVPACESLNQPGALLTITDLVRYAQEVSETRDLTRLINLRSILVEAEKVASDTPDEQVSDEPIDPDWFSRWRSGAEDVSAEKMQQLWARVLAGEVRSPGSYSLRTLQFLSNLNQRDAQLIERIAPFRIDNAILRDDEILKNKGIQFSDLLLLDDLGVIQGVEAVGGLVLKADSNDSEKFYVNFLCQEKAIVVEGQVKGAPFEIEIFGLTQVGREVLSLGNFRADSDCLGKIADIAKKRGLSAKAGVWHRDSEGMIRVDSFEKL
ncbi:MAG: DUF2806 domain-containing protein [Alphaproteobacteria bacterium]